MPETINEGSLDPEEEGVFIAEQLPSDIPIRTLQEVKARGGFIATGNDNQGKPIPIAVTRISRLENFFKQIFNR